MMIRPIDLADNLSKAPYADRVNKVQQRQPETEQQAFHARFLEKVAEEQSRAPKTEEEHRVRNEQEQAQGERQDEEERKSDAPEADDGDAQALDDDVLGQNVDVVV